MKQKLPYTPGRCFTVIPSKPWETICFVISLELQLILFCAPSDVFGFCWALPPARAILCKFRGSAMYGANMKSVYRHASHNWPAHAHNTHIYHQLTYLFIFICWSYWTDPAYLVKRCWYSRLEWVYQGPLMDQGVIYDFCSRASFVSWLNSLSIADLHWEQYGCVEKIVIGERQLMGRETLLINRSVD